MFLSTKVLLSFICFVCIVYIVCIVYRYTYTANHSINEHFETGPEQTFTLNKLNYPDQLFVPLGQQAYDKIVTKDISPSTSISILMDLPTLFKLKGNDTKGLERGPSGYIIALVDAKKNTAWKDCSHNIVGKRIGCMTYTELNIIECIARGYRIPKGEYQTEIIPLTKWDSLEELAKTKYDFIVAFMIPDTPMHSLLRRSALPVRGFSTLDIDRIRLFYPYADLVELNLMNLFPPSNETSTSTKTDITNVLTIQEGVWRKGGAPLLASTTVANGREGFITRLFVDPENKDANFRCYGDPRASSKEACNSNYDALGNDRQVTTEWDKPCTTNEECPFYRANKNYVNERGKCTSDGTCELPVGVNRLSSRKYSTTFPYSPFCYSCDNPLNPLCCVGQDKPDYAFPKDAGERDAAGLQTVIPFE